MLPFPGAQPPQAQSPFVRPRLLGEKREELLDQANKLRTGLFKIDETREKVEVMSLELEDAKKKVAEFQKQCEEYLVIIVQQKREADEQQKVLPAPSLWPRPTPLPLNGRWPRPHPSHPAGSGPAPTPLPPNGPWPRPTHPQPPAPPGRGFQVAPPDQVKGHTGRSSDFHPPGQYYPHLCPRPRRVLSVPRQ